ncbi:MAG: AEC family transporter [Candidatus Omnitrophica bacterium]|nr:AEC family transporter [Candidatus Omnitrophota bacterium]
MWIRILEVSGKAVLKLFLLSFIGFFLVKRNVLNKERSKNLSRFVVGVSLPVMIFCQLIKNFNFNQFSNWWVFPIISFVITLLGLIIATLFFPFLNGLSYKLQFLSLVAFQNSGYLPLALVAAILPKEKLGLMFIYIFLFLLGFNLIMWSLGVFLICASKKKMHFELANFFSPPAVATILTLILIYFRLNKFIPFFIYRPLEILGDTTLPLAMIVVGASLAQLHLDKIDKKAMFFLILAKLIIMPTLGLFFIIRFKLSELISLLILIELAVPSATSLSLIVNHYKKEDLLISQGIILSHLFSLITLPIFLSLYFSWIW